MSVRLTETEQRAITVGTILQALHRKISVNTKLEKDVAYLPGYIDSNPAFVSLETLPTDPCINLIKPSRDVEILSSKQHGPSGVEESMTYLYRVVLSWSCNQ